MNDLMNLLKSLGVKVDKATNIHPKYVKGISIDKLIPGEWLESRGERVFQYRIFYPFGSQHGTVTLANENYFKNQSEFWGIDEIKTFELNNFLFLDMETSGLSSGAGSLAFMFGGCYFSAKGLEVTQLFLDDPTSETLFLSLIDKLIADHNCLVSYNGKSFDIPVLRTRMVLNYMNSEKLNRNHLDLLHFSRMVWKMRLESRRLSDIEKEILAFKRNEEEVPGWIVPQLYQDYLLTGNALPMKGVFYHNGKDVVSLAALFLHLSKAISTLESISTMDRQDILSIGRIYQKKGNVEMSEKTYKLGLNRFDIGNVEVKVLRNFANLLKKQSKWSEAIKCWESAANQNDTNSCIELSKYYEHQVKNFNLALYWAEEAIKINRDSFSSEGSSDLIRRRKRIIGKIQLNDT